MLDGQRTEHKKISVLTPIRKKQQLGDATKTLGTGRNGRQKGRFFSSRPVTWCILVISPQIPFVYLHIYGFASPKNFESRLKTTSPQIPCLRRVPFEATKRNQKSPLGAGPAICIARLAPRDAQDPVACNRSRISGSGVERNRALCSGSALEGCRRGNRHGLLSTSSRQPEAVPVKDRPGESPISSPQRGQPQGIRLQIE